ncbi:MAG: hypothetical protein ACRDJC_10575 [Thermomicrobiales bacterium]
MSEKPSSDEVRRRVRGLATPSLLLILAGFGNAEVAGPVPADAVARLEALRDEAAAELERRGIVAVPDPSMVARMTYRGDASRAFGPLGSDPRKTRRKGFQA